MIYVSSSCIKNKKICDTVKTFAENNIYNIELSGGTDFYEHLEKDLLNLKMDYGLNYIVHNYFPPPKKHFILNLASLDNNIWQKSLNFMKNSIELAIRLGAPAYGLHAGFFVNPKLNEIGKRFNKQSLFNKNESTIKFVKGYKILNDLYSDNIDLYIENNVISEENYKEFGVNPFMLTSFDDYNSLKKLLEFNMLFDIGHMKVSAHTLSLNYKKEIDSHMAISKYIHVSDNNGKTDSNWIPRNDTFIYNYLKDYGINNKLVTLELNAEFEMIKNLYEEMNLWN